MNHLYVTKSKGDMTYLLRKINMTSNNIQHLNPKTFDKMSYLVDLDLSDNKLSIITAGCFHGLTELKYLHIKYNLIKAILKDYFLHLEKLQVLDISHNEILKIEEGGFNGLHQLRILFLHHNPLYDVDDSLGLSVPLLANVHADENRICCTLSYVTECHAAGNILNFISCSRHTKYTASAGYVDYSYSCYFYEHCSSVYIIIQESIPGLNHMDCHFHIFYMEYFYV